MVLREFKRFDFFSVCTTGSALFRVLFTILAMLAAAPIGALAGSVSIPMNDKGAASYTPIMWTSTLRALSAPTI